MIRIRWQFSLRGLLNQWRIQDFIEGDVNRGRAPAYFSAKLHKNEENCIYVDPLLQMQLKTRIHSSRMRTAHSLPYGGVSVQGSLSRGISVQEGLCLLRPTPPVNRMTHRCTNITLPQSSFAGGNNSKI